MLEYKSGSTKILILLLVTLKGTSSYLICNLMQEFLYLPLKEEHRLRVYVNKMRPTNIGPERKIEIKLI
jgi:hypothetical protein